MSVEGIAIIGMAGRFPGAASVAELWEVIKQGRETISHLTWDEIDARDPTALARDPAYVRSRGLLEGVELFDAGFFGMTPAEAEVTDPQQRLFLEICWEALEHAGWDPARYPGAIGVFAGQSLGTYLLSNLAHDRRLLDRVAGEYQVGSYPMVLGNDKDYLATRVCYKLDLKGPGMTVQCACSTSLVAVAQGVASLLSYQSDMVLAGGVSITFPQRRGYLFQDGGMVSPDGHCRSFDAQAAGTVFSSGAAVVLLKRVEDALADGDRIHAVIKAAALNNDGALKAGYMAPSPQRQAEVIATALALADVSADTIGLIEAHGTGTPLGDPIEVDGLTRAFRASTGRKGYCALGSLKSNTGHMEVAAGVSGLIKATLAVRDGLLPPSLHYTAPNPQIDFAESPFFVNTELKLWPGTEHPRRAGVSAFGVGGTNAHLILEQAPEPPPAGVDWPAQMIPLSARSETALREQSLRLAALLRAEPALPLADVAFTLQEGRRAFPHRRAVVSATAGEAATALEKPFASTPASASPPVVFLMPGQGAQHPAMGAALYRHSQVFREEADRCLALLAEAGTELRGLLFQDAPHAPELAARLQQTAVTQPAIFTLEIALAKFWESLGIVPAAFVGHSVGEFAAAALAGVIDLPEAARLVAERGRLVQALPPGAMLSVRLPAEELVPLLSGGLSLASENGPQLSVASGPAGQIDALERVLAARNVVSRRLRTSHAFHSAMMDAALEPFTTAVGKATLRPARVPIASTLLGRMAEPGELDRPDYWVRHMREPVRFLPAVRAAAALPGAILLEVGPGRALSTLARQAGATAAFASLPDPGAEEGELPTLLEAAGRLFCAGAPLRFAGLHPGRRQRVSLPTYPFERKRHFVEPPPLSSPAATSLAVADDSIEAVVAAQLVLMQEQLSLLRAEESRKG